MKRNEWYSLNNWEKMKKNEGYSLNICTKDELKNEGDMLK